MPVLKGFCILLDAYIKPKYVDLTILVFFLIFAMTAPNFEFQSSNMLLKGMSSVSFSVFVYLLVKKTCSSIEIKTKTLVNYLGQHTMEIYLTQFCLVQICSSQWIDTGIVNGIPLFMMVLLSIPISLLVVKVSDVLKAIPAMPLLLYGKNHRNK